MRSQIRSKNRQQRRRPGEIRDAITTILSTKREPSRFRTTLASLAASLVWSLIAFPNAGADPCPPEIDSSYNTCVTVTLAPGDGSIPPAGSTWGMGVSELDGKLSQSQVEPRFAPFPGSGVKILPATVYGVTTEEFNFFFSPGAYLCGPTGCSSLPYFGYLGGGAVCGPAGLPFTTASLAQYFCTGGFDAKIYARYGSASGHVTTPDGTPVPAGVAVAAYRTDAPQQPTVVYTDESGRYDFTRVNDPLFQQNNWGLFVTCVGEGCSIGGVPGRLDYILVAGPQALPPTSPTAVTVMVESSKMTQQDLIAEGVCPIGRLTQITDADALDFEAQNGQVFRYTDRAGNNRMDPRMIPDPVTGDSGAIACLQSAITSRGGNWSPQSAWRPAAYQAHLREVWTKWQDLIKVKTPECALRKSEIRMEIDRHGLLNLGIPPAVDSAHTRGTAIDISANFNIGPDGPTIDEIAGACGLKRLRTVRGRNNDPGHFSLGGD